MLVCAWEVARAQVGGVGQVPGRAWGWRVGEQLGVWGGSMGCGVTVVGGDGGDGGVGQRGLREGLRNGVGKGFGEGPGGG